MKLTRSPFPCPRSGRGFTLIELMITVALIAVLASIAMPAYFGYVQKGKRATAQGALMELASKEQTYLLDRRAYTATLSDINFSAPSSISSDYTFSLVVDNTTSPPSFVATARPVSNSQKANNEPNLTVDNLGAKTPLAYWSR